MSDNKIIKLRNILAESQSMSRNSHIEAQGAYEYERGNQLPDDVKETLAHRGQPQKWENLYKKIGNKLSGMKMMTRQEISAYPRNAKDRQKGDLLTKVLRSFQDSTEWWTHKQRADKDLRLTGLSVIEVILKELDEYDSNGVSLKELEYIHLPVNECYIDMYSNSPDMSDMRYFTHSKLLDVASLKELFPQFEVTYKVMVDGKGLVNINRTWYRDDNNKIRFAIWTDSGTILQDIETPFAKLNQFPIAIRKLNYNPHHAEFYGMFRDVKPFQDTINNTMLRLINMLGSSKLIIESDAVDDIDSFVEHYTLDNSVSEVRAGALRENKIKDITLNAPIAQLMNIVQDARFQAEQVIGLNAEALGSAVNRLSGYAIENRQNAGMVGLQDYIDCSGNIDIDIAQISIKIMAEHFKAEQVLLIANGDEKEHITINEYERAENGNMKYKDSEPVQNRLIESSRFDLVLSQVPFNRGATGERQKNWTEIIKVLQITEPNLVASMLPLMLRDVDSPEAKEASRVIEEYKKSQQEATPQQDPMADKLALEMEKLKAQIEELQTQAELNTAKANLAKNSDDKLTMNT